MRLNLIQNMSSLWRRSYSRRGDWRSM